MATPIRLTPKERALRASAAAHAAHAKHGSARMTTAARQVANFDRFADQIDPERQLPADELAKRVEHARKAHMKGLSLIAAKSKRSKARERSQARSAQAEAARNAA